MFFRLPVDQKTEVFILNEYNNNRPANLVLLHAHCHDASHGQRCE